MLILYIKTKEVGLELTAEQRGGVNSFSVGVLYGETVSGCRQPSWRRRLWLIVSTHTVSVHSGHPFEPHAGRLCHPWRLRRWSPWHGCVHVDNAFSQNVHSEQHGRVLCSPSHLSSPWTDILKLPFTAVLFHNSYDAQAIQLPFKKWLDKQVWYIWNITWP